mmetsp:Transcript_70207/g.196789  ORF Transcript_70207/g.196789 Transcript_70207/m.196789 type:complete len:331 (+) Transcript_70207:120-1112(+)
MATSEQRRSLVRRRARDHRCHEVDVVLVVEVLHFASEGPDEAVLVVEEQRIDLGVDHLLVHVRLQRVAQVLDADQAVGGVLREGLEGLGDVVRRVLHLDLAGHDPAELGEVDLAVPVQVDFLDHRLQLGLLDVQPDRVEQHLQLLDGDVSRLVPLHEGDVVVVGVLGPLPAQLLEQAEDLPELLHVLAGQALLLLGALVLLLRGRQLLGRLQGTVELFQTDVAAAVLVCLHHDDVEVGVAHLKPEHAQSFSQLVALQGAVAARVELVEEVAGAHAFLLQQHRELPQALIGVHLRRHRWWWRSLAAHKLATPAAQRAAPDAGGYGGGGTRA